MPCASVSSSLASVCFYFVFLAKTLFASSWFLSEIDYLLHYRSILRCRRLAASDASSVAADWFVDTMHLHLSPSSSQFYWSSPFRRLHLLRHVYSDQAIGQHEGVFLPVSYAESNGEVGTIVGENKSALPRLASLPASSGDSSPNGLQRTGGEVGLLSCSSDFTSAPSGPRWAPL